MLGTNAASNSRVSSTARSSHGKQSSLASPSVSISSRAYYPSVNTRSCSARSLPRFSRPKCRKRSLTRVRYAPTALLGRQSLTGQAYGRAKAKFGFFSSLFSLVQNLGVVYGDVLPKFWALSGVFLARYLPTGFQGEISQTLVFFFLFNLVSTATSLPISYYKTFILEEKFGFNKQTLKLWVTDMLKGQMLGIALGAPIMSAVLKIIQVTGTSFFYYLWLFTVFVQFSAISIYPILILPLFNKLSPLEPGELKTGVEGLAKKLNFPLHELYVIDGSKRSSHSNAYFYGLPWKKHIVIYDTLIEKSKPDEVVAVLGHELGHWQLSHTTKLLVIAQVGFSGHPNDQVTC